MALLRSAISGGTFANLATSAFNTHATNDTLTFTGQPSNGLLTCTYNDSNGLHSQCVAEVTPVNGKFVIFVIWVDNSSNARHIILNQM